MNSNCITNGLRRLLSWKFNFRVVWKHCELIFHVLKFICWSVGYDSLAIANEILDKHAGAVKSRSDAVCNSILMVVILAYVVVLSNMSSVLHLCHTRQLECILRECTLRECTLLVSFVHCHTGTFSGTPCKVHPQASALYTHWRCKFTLWRRCV